MSNTNQPLPLPAFVGEIKELPAKISKAQAEEILAIGRGNLMVPQFEGFDPLARHRPLADGEKENFSSRFYAPTPEQAGIPQIAEDDEIVLEAGHGGREVALVIHVVKKDEFVGEYFPSVVPENTGIIIRKDPRGHGLQPFATNEGYWGGIKPESSGEFSICVYNTQGEENAGWVLASAYPGPQDPDPDMTGLKEGDLLTPAEAKRRRLRVRPA